MGSRQNCDIGYSDGVGADEDAEYAVVKWALVVDHCRGAPGSCTEDMHTDV